MPNFQGNIELQKKKKKTEELPDWFKAAVVDPSAEAPAETQPQAEQDIPDWFRAATVQEEPTRQFSDEEINVNYEAPPSIRLQVDTLKKQDDKLRVLRKHYPDAQPHGDGNFIMTNPENGEVMLYNQEGWIPSLGDLAGSAGTAAEIAGATVGGIGGGFVGGTSGSIVPFAGTAAGATTGAIAGAGLGGATGRDLAERAVNWYYGNEDTRSLDEYAKDKAFDVAVNAAGEGTGAAIMKGAQAVHRPIAKWLLGKGVDKEASAARASAMAEADIPMTYGAVTNSPRAMKAEADLIAKNPHSRVAQTVDDIDKGLQKRFDGITTDLAGATNPALKPTTGQQVGEALMARAEDANKALTSERNRLYGNVDAIVGGTPIKSGANTEKLLQQFEAEKAGMGAVDKLNNGKAIDEVIDQAKAAHTDLQGGTTFGKAQQTKSTIGKLGYGAEPNEFVAARMKQLNSAIDGDMADTAKSVGADAFDAWKKADAYNASLYAKDGPKAALKDIIKKPTPEEAYSYLNQQIKKGGTRLKAVREQIEAAGGAGEWDQYVGSYLAEKGSHIDPATGASVFSPKKYLQEISKISPEASAELFAGPQRQAFKQDLDKFTRIVQGRVEMMGAKAKPQDSGTKLLAYFTAPISGPAGMAKRAYTDRLLTDQNFIRWANGIPKAQYTRGGLMDHVHTLRLMAREAARTGTADGEAFRNAVNQYLSDTGIEEEEKKNQ